MLKLSSKFRLRSFQEHPSFQSFKVPRYQVFKVKVVTPKELKKQNHLNKGKGILEILIIEISTNLSANTLKQETIQKSNEKPAVPTQSQNYSEVTLHTKTFPTIPIMLRLVGGSPVYWGDKGEATKWKINI
jgi:hypothetical protein